MQCNAGEMDGCHKPEGLLQYLWWVRPLSMVQAAPLTERSMIARMNRPWLKSTNVVGDDLLEDGRCALFGELSAAELMLERLRHVTPSLVGHAECGWTFCEWRCDARGGTQTEPRHRIQLPSSCLVLHARGHS